MRKKTCAMKAHLKSIVTLFLLTVKAEDVKSIHQKDDVSGETKRQEEHLSVNLVHPPSSPSDPLLCPALAVLPLHHEDQPRVQA